VGGYAWIDWHHCSSADMMQKTKPNSHLNSSDCGGILHDQDAAHVGQWTRNAIDKNTGLVIYGFDDREFRADLIDAMGREIQAGGPGTYLTAGQPAAGDTLNAMRGTPLPWARPLRFLTDPTRFATAWWAALDAACALRPMTLILSDWDTLHDLVQQPDFPSARLTATLYVFSRVVWVGEHFNDEGDDEIKALKARWREIETWWDEYLVQVVERLRQFPTLRIQIVTGRDHDDMQRQWREGTLARIPSEFHGRVS
jgi:hypothetical protein